MKKCNPFRAAGARASWLATALLAVAAAHAEQPRIMVLTSDPQYPWTPATDAGEHSDKADKALAESLIREQYRSIDAFRRQYPGQSIPVIVNGDITSQSKRSEQQKISELFATLGNELYYGLGNHDYQNNLTNAVCNLLYCAMEALDNLAHHVHSHRTRSNVLGFDMLATPYPSGGIRKEGSWSYAFTADGWDRVIQFQLNNFPEYSASMDWGFGSYSYHYRVTSSVPWLEEHLPEYSDPRVSDLVLVHTHQPDTLRTSWSGKSNDLQKLLKRHKVAAIFAGHLHERMGRYDRGGADDIPVFLSGSASQRTYLIVEHWPESKQLKVYGVRDNTPAHRELIGQIDL
ncbi:metallophosphoesterase [Xanthomonas sp. NCPPB 2632]|uniref:metallophosphoesterase family protein n=1 Tax=Xanthomonas sp. NCPPB 2632 TaxID=3240912 RepID=UPI0035125CB7